MNTPKIDLKSAVLLLILAALWGGSFLFAGIALKQVPPLSITLHRVFWAVLVLLALVRWQGLKFPRVWRVWRAWLVMGALNNAIPFSLIFWGQTRIESGLASILNGTTAVFGAVVAGVLLKDEPLTGRKLLGAGFGLAGVAAIMGPEALKGFDPRNLAQLAILAAALSYALASVWGKVMLKGIPPQMNALGMLMGSTVLMIPVVLLVDGPPAMALSPGIWAALIALALLSTVLAYQLYFTILTRAGAANLMLVTLMIPPFAVGFGVMFLYETPSPEAAIGFALIAIGLAITDGRLLRRIKKR